MTFDAKDLNNQIDIRLLATSDVHMNLSGFSETTGLPTPQSGLARLARVIEKARKEAVGAVLLIDNGDLLQGTPMAQTALDTSDVTENPIVLMTQALGFDAFGLGNHDFDFGQTYLEQLIAALPGPTLSANTHGVAGVKRRVIIDCEGVDQAGAPFTLRVGLTSALPEQTGQWTAFLLSGSAEFTEPVAAVKAQVSALKAEGADIVVVAAHGGLDAVPEPSGSENFAHAIRKMPGVDAVIAGHPHQRVPLPGSVALGEACVMPGYGADHLGCIDLHLERHAKGWCVTSKEASLLAIDGAEPVPELTALLAPARAATSQRLAQQITTSNVTMHSFFSMVKPCPGMGLLADAMISGLDRMELPCEWQDLPKLAAVAPALSGGRAGPDQYVNIPAGPVTYLAIESLFPFEDVLCAKRLSGRDLREWLERSVAIYADLTGPHDTPPFLLQFDMPGFCFDMIAGLSVQIDPTRPARYDAVGNCISPLAQRIVDVRWQGAPLRDDDLFVLAMSSFRFDGGGRFPDVGTSLPKRVHGPPIRTLLHDLCEASSVIQTKPPDWGFVPDLGIDVLYSTSPQALDMLDTLAVFSPEVVRVTSKGFLQLQLTF